MTAERMKDLCCHAPWRPGWGWPNIWPRDPWLPPDWEWPKPLVPHPAPVPHDSFQVSMMRAEMEMLRAEIVRLRAENRRLAEAARHRDQDIGLPVPAGW